MLYLIWSISLLVGIIASIGAKDKYGLFYNHYMVLNVWWHLNLFLSLFTIWNNSIYYNTYFIFFSGLLIFNLTVVFIPNYKAVYRKKRWGYINIQKRRLVEISIAILLIPFIRIFYDLISSGMELWALRQFLRSDEGRRDYGSSVILIYFIVPVSVTLMITAYYKYYLHTKRHSNKISLLISLLITIVLGLIDGGGRTLLFNWMLFYVYIGFCNSKKNHIYFNDNGKINIYIIALPIIGIMAMTILRGIFDIVTLKTLNELLQGRSLIIGLFDYYLKHPSVSGFTSNTFGLSSFENIFLLINYPFRLIFRNDSYFIDYQAVDSIIQVFRKTESGLTGNAGVSMFFRFMRDWGYLGIFIGPILLAWFVNKLYVLSLRDGLNFFFYLYTVLLLTNTMGELVFNKNSYLLVFIWFFILKKFFLTKKKLKLL
jgi:oligosaccharide repeat unit polymerase